MPVENPTILFDGVCNLCNGAVQFIIRRDPRARFRFAALDSPAAGALLAGTTALPALPDSIILIEPGTPSARLSTQSTAILRIARGLRFPWPLLSIFILIPRPIRDWVYSVIARNRYRWFGRRESCMVPTPDLRERFLS